MTEYPTANTNFDKMSETGNAHKRKDLLEVKDYFFVLKKDRIYLHTFDASYCTDKIVVAHFANKKEADVFKRLLAVEGLKHGIDYIEGYCDEKSGLAYYPNEWLNFIEASGKFYVKHV